MSLYRVRTTLLWAQLKLQLQLKSACHSAKVLVTRLLLPHVSHVNFKIFFHPHLPPAIFLLSISINKRFMDSPERFVPSPQGTRHPRYPRRGHLPDCYFCPNGDGATRASSRTSSFSACVSVRVAVHAKKKIDFRSPDIFEKPEMLLLFRSFWQTLK